MLAFTGCIVPHFSISDPAIGPQPNLFHQCAARWSWCHMANEVGCTLLWPRSNILVMHKIALQLPGQASPLGGHDTQFEKRCYSQGLYQISCIIGKSLFFTAPKRHVSKLVISDCTLKLNRSHWAFLPSFGLHRLFRKSRSTWDYHESQPVPSVSAGGSRHHLYSQSSGAHDCEFFPPHYVTEKSINLIILGKWIVITKLQMPLRPPQRLISFLGTFLFALLTSFSSSFIKWRCQRH